MLLEEAYNTIYGVIDMDNSGDPLSLISYTNADTLGDYGPWGECLSEFRNHDVHGVFGLSFNEYLDLPFPLSRLLINRCRTEKEDEEEIKKQAQAEADRLEREAKKKR